MTIAPHSPLTNVDTFAVKHTIIKILTRKITVSMPHNRLRFHIVELMQLSIPISTTDSYAEAASRELTSEAVSASGRHNGVFMIDILEIGNRGVL
jgi:hypothetical protein